MQPSLTRRLCSGVPSMLTAPFRSSSYPSSRREGRTKSAAGRRSSAVQLAGMKTLTSRPVSDRAKPDLTVPCTVSDLGADIAQVFDDLRREDDVAEAGLCLVGTDARERFVEPGIKIAHLAVVVGVHADVLQPFPPLPDCCCALAEHIAVARVRGLREDLAGNIAVSGLAQGLEEIFCAERAGVQVIAVVLDHTAQQLPRDDISPERMQPEDFLVVIEIEKGSKNKYEMDKQTGALRLDRILYTSTHYPANYGFIPRTYADDGDPLDVLVLCSEPIRPMSLVRVYPVGYFTMRDNGAMDDKILAIPFGDPMFNGYSSLSDLPAHISNEISHFFSVYKHLEPDTNAEVDSVHGRAEAVAVIREAFAAYRRKFNQ